ncbi:MAG: hypothetical protein FWB71_01675 [Defluviitaleaceae bacterium]|nr:hypothetical protein [Defluviitaleaceae bacterium]
MKFRHLAFGLIAAGALTATGCGSMANNAAGLGQPTGRDGTAYSRNLGRSGRVRENHTSRQSRRGLNGAVENARSLGNNANAARRNDRTVNHAGNPAINQNGHMEIRNDTDGYIGNNRYNHDADNTRHSRRNAVRPIGGAYMVNDTFAYDQLGEHYDVGSVFHVTNGRVASAHDNSRVVPATPATPANPGNPANPAIPNDTTPATTLPAPNPNTPATTLPAPNPNTPARPLPGNATPTTRPTTRPATPTAPATSPSR